MPLTVKMRDLFAKFTTTEDSTSERFGSTGAYLRVGSSTATFDSADNELRTTSTGSTGANNWIKAMDGSFPTRTNNLLTYRSTFTTSEANNPWNEIGVKNTTASATSTSGTATLMQRLVSTDMGTKVSTQSWQVTLQVTVST